MVEPRDPRPIAHEAPSWEPRHRDVFAATAEFVADASG
jgi:hypothetical protein